jgi:hypothetical protein
MRVVLVKSDARAREKPCLRCGYSLRKIVDSTHCPECGLSIWLSLNSNDSLDWSKASWLRQMAVAAWLMAAVQLIGIAAFVMIWRERPPQPVFSTMTDENGAVMPMMTRTPPRPHQAATDVAAAAYCFLYSAALALLAGYEGRHPDKWRTFRLACRIAAGAGMLVGIYTLLARSPGLFTLSMVASAIATFAYLRKIAQRIPHALLSRICGIVLLAPVLSLLKALPVFWIFAAFQVFGIIEYVPWVYLPVSVVLLGWFAILLRRSSQHAAEAWRKETAGETISQTERAMA